MRQATAAKNTAAKGTTAKSGAGKKETGKADASAAIPKVLDIRKLLEKLKLPGVDVEALLESHRKDVETLIAANEKAYLGLQALTRRQAEILAEAMQDLQEGTKELLATKGVPDRAGRTASRTKQAFGQALSNMREVAEMAAKSHEEVIAILNKRVHEGLDGLRDQLNRKH